MEREPLDLGVDETASLTRETIAEIEMRAAKKSQTAKVRVPVRDFVQRIIEAVRAAPFNTDEIKELYQAICNRMVNKTCYFCGRLVPEIEGTLVFPDGDMSKPKRFVCQKCK